jgi:hypothetical protein
MSKIIVPLHLANLYSTPNGVDTGFKKFYLKSGWLKLYDGASEIDVVLDRPLDGYNPTNGVISPSDTVLSAIEKLGYGISYITNPQWGTISGNILSQADLLLYLSDNYYPLLSNPANYITQQSVLEYPDLASFPTTGVTNTIYIAIDTDIAYYWDGSAYVVITGSTSGITGFGIVNRLAKFTPTGSAIGSSKIIEFSGGATIINSSNRNFLDGNSIVSIQRPQSQIDFILGNPALGQSSFLISDNDLAGFEIRSKGELSLKTGSTYSNEGLKVYTSGQLKLTQTPATGTTSDYILLRDTSGNLKQIVYPSIPAGGLPPGGTVGQILTKVDATDYNATWQENYADWTSQVKHIVKNNGLSGTITKGTAVYVTSSDGTNMLVGRASNTSEATSSKTMGLMQSNITTTGGTQTGFVITEGLLSGLNTAGQTAGDPVWLGVNGALIYGLVNKPYAPAHLVFIGIVTKISAGNGEIFVKVQNGFELKEIHDVDLITTTPINGDLLGYNGTLWVNKTVAGWLGYTPANRAGDTFTGNIDAPSMSLNGVNLESLMIAYAVALG